MPSQKSLRSAFDASNQKTAHFDLYRTQRNGSTIILNLFPGTTGQAALTDILLEGKAPDKGRVGTIKDYELGTDNDVYGKFLDVYTVVTDVSKESNDLSLDFNLAGGVVPYRYYMQRTVQNEGASVVYKVSILFIGK